KTFRSTICPPILLALGRSCASPPGATTLCFALCCQSPARKHTSLFQQRDWRVSRRGSRRPDLIPSISHGRPLTIRTVHRTGGSGHWKPRTPASFSGATEQSSKHWTGSGDSAKLRRHAYSSSLERQEPASRHSCVPG